MPQRRASTSRARDFRLRRVVCLSRTFCCDDKYVSIRSMHVLTDKQIMANIAANIQRLRGTRSSYWLAKQIDVATVQITRIERGENMPRASMLHRIAEALETTTDALMSADAGTFSTSGLTR